MAVNTNTIVSNVYAQNYTPGSKEKNESSQEYGNRGSKERREGNGIKDLGKTIGDPKLSKEAQKVL